jgi:hypothetical protein
MQRRAGRIVVVICVLIAIGATTAVAAPPAQADSTMTITPNGALVDGQVVTVTVTGLTPLSVAGVAQCVEGHDVDGCEMESRSFVSTDENGSFTTTVALHAMLATPIGPIDCRTSSEACVLGANTALDEAGAVWTTTAFDPVGPVQPAPTLDAQPAVGLVDGQTVTLSGSGYPTNTGYAVLLCATGTTDADCARSGYPTIAFTGPSGTFTQQVQVRSGIATRGGDFVDCRTAPGTCELRVGTSPVTNRTGIASLAFDPNGPLTPRPSLSIDPSTDLVDGQVVHVTVVGLDVGGGVQLLQCASDGNRCQSVAFAPPGGSGPVELDARVEARLWFGDGAAIDCRVEACTMVATSYPTLDRAVATLHFDPDAPFVPVPVLEGTPDADLVDGQVIDLHGHGFSAGLGYVVTPVLPAAASPSTTIVAPDDPVVGVQMSMPAIECRSGGTDFGDCDFGTMQSVALADDGTITGRFQVDAVIDTDAGPVDCRTDPAGCEVRTGVIGHPYKQGVLALGFDEDAPLAPPPTFSVDPATDLVDGQLVQVRGDGLPIARMVLVLQCAAGQSFLDSCYMSVGSATVDADGHAQVGVAVQRLLPQGFADPIDCAATAFACELVVLDASYDDIAHLGIDFRAVEPPPTDPPITEPPSTDPPTTDGTDLDVVVVDAAVQTRPLFTG